MTREEAVKAISTYFEENEDEFNETIESLDWYNDYLGDDKCFPMDELNEIFCNDEPMEILQRAFFGHDDDNWHTNSFGVKEHTEFNPNRNYFYFNGYGNLVSTDYKDYSDKLDDYFCEQVIDYCGHIDMPSEVEEIIDSIEG